MRAQHVSPESHVVGEEVRPPIVSLEDLAAKREEPSERHGAAVEAFAVDVGVPGDDMHVRVGEGFDHSGQPAILRNHVTVDDHQQRRPGLGGTAVLEFVVVHPRRSDEAPSERCCIGWSEPLPQQRFEFGNRSALGITDDDDFDDAVEHSNLLSNTAQHLFAAAFAGEPDVLPLDDQSDLRHGVHGVGVANMKVRSRPPQALWDHGRKRTARP